MEGGLPELIVCLRLGHTPYMIGHANIPTWVTKLLSSPAQTSGHARLGMPIIQLAIPILEVVCAI